MGRNSFCRFLKDGEIIETEVKKWWKGALLDLDNARETFERKKYFGAVFYCQQAVEQSLKALYIFKTKELPKIDTSSVLAGELGIPQNFHSLIKGLISDFPYRFYDKDTASEILQGSEELLKWIESQISIVPKL